jgi:hypothetical protein
VCKPEQMYKWIVMLFRLVLVPLATGQTSGPVPAQFFSLHDNYLNVGTGTRSSLPWVFVVGT